MSETISVPGDDVLSRIRYRPGGRNPIEARIATAILEDPERVRRESITSFAGRTSVSAGSVVRFAKLMGFGGYRELKLSLATTGNASVPRFAAGAQSQIRGYLDEQVRAVMFAAEELDPGEIARAAALIARAPRVDISATGSSASVAHGLQFSLMLLGLHVRYLPDTLEQAAAAAFLQPGDCLIAVSYSGRTRLIVDAAARAAASGANVVAVCANARSPLLRHAGLVLLLDAAKARFEGEGPLRTAMAAIGRTLGLAVADQLNEADLRERRTTWASGRFGLRYDQR